MHCTPRTRKDVVLWVVYIGYCVLTRFNTKMKLFRRLGFRVKVKMQVKVATPQGEVPTAGTSL